MSLMLTVLAIAVAAQPVQSTMEAPGPHGALQGTILAPPVSGSPVVLILPGSGPTDRDGNNPNGLRAASSRLLAEALAERGVTTVRIDKRGMFGSRAAAPDPNAVTIADYATDARNWVRAVRRRTGARCVWLLGHSEGGLVALAAGPGADDVCGLLLIASPGRPVGEVMREQLRANLHLAPVLDQALAGIASLEARRPVALADVPPMLMGLFAPQLQPFMMDLLSYDPAAMLRTYERPVLILHGARDIQVSEADARRLAAANPRARLTILSGVNHVLKEVASDDRAANFATYGDANLPLAPGVADAITQFIREHTNAPKYPHTPHCSTFSDNKIGAKPPVVRDVEPSDCLRSPCL